MKSMAEQIDSSPNESTLRLKVEEWAKIAASFVLSLYVIGLVAVNGYLFGLGASDFSLVRPRFIYAGASICALTAIAYGWPAEAIQSIRESRGRIKGGASIAWWGKLELLVFEPFLLFFIPVTIFFAILVSYPTFEEGLENYPAALGLALFLTLAGFSVGSLYLRLVGTTIRRIRENTLTPSLTGLAVFFAILFGAVYIPLFMNTVYNKLPEQFGGGRPQDGTTSIY